MSVVVCTRNRPHLLDAALDAVDAALRPGDELVVVDSASDPPITSKRTLVRVAQPGLSRARNAGVAHTRNPLVAFTDDDCVASPGWVEQLAEAFDDERVGVANGLVKGGEAAPADDPGAAPFRFDATVDVATLGAGANMAFRRDAITAIGGFDERLGAGTPLRSGEDHDAMWRVLRAGWIGEYIPDAVVEHRSWRSAGETVAMRWAYGIGAGAVAAKVAKVDAHAGRRMLWRRGWTYGLHQAVVDGKRGYQRAAIGDVLYAAGAVVGAAVVWRTPLTAGMLG